MNSHTICWPLVSVTGRVRFPGMMMLIQLEKQIRSLLSQLKQIDIIAITCHAFSYLKEYNINRRIRWKKGPDWHL